MKAIFNVVDGGEQYWYVAADGTDAIEQHKKFNYGEATGVELTATMEAELSAYREPDGARLKVEVDEGGDAEGYVERTAKEWAAIESGFLGSTVY